LGALAAGFFFAAFRERREGGDALRRGRAFAAAEYGLYRVLVPGDWHSAWNSTAARGVLATRSYELGNGAVDTVRLWKLTAMSFRVTSDATAGAGPWRAARRLGLLLTLRAPTIVPIAALAVVEGVTVMGDARVDGADTSPAPWSCPPDGAPLAGLAATDSSRVDLAGCTAAACASGDPPIRIAPNTASDVRAERLGDVSRAELAALGDELPLPAELTPAPRVGGDGMCDDSDVRNLGDPLNALGAESPCADYAPVRHASGDARITGGTGQGFLMVDGDLTIDAGTQFFGAVLVRGTLHLTGGAVVTGIVLADRAIIDESSTVRFSRCALARALRGAGLPIVPHGPTWTER
jgi:hypothetical protein